MKDKLWLWLTLLKGITGKKISILIEKFGSPEAIYEAEKNSFTCISGISEKDAEILSDKSLAKANKVIEVCRKKGIGIITFDSPLYPQSLKNIYDPPYVLYVRCKGKFNLNEHICITIVGTRKPTEYGVGVTGMFAEQLALSGFTVVSGMASGLDSVSLGAALSVGGKVVAVLGCGVDRCYPEENKNLFAAIIENGIVMSEFPPGTPPLKANFPKRNRIMSALSVGTLVTEAPIKSGTLITASDALEQNKEVYAIPGNITRTSSQGCNALIAQLGAKLVYDAESIICDFKGHYADILEKNKPIANDGDGEEAEENDLVLFNEKYKGLSEQEQAIIKEISPVPVHIDQIIEKTKIPAEELTSKLTILEISGLIKAHPGMMFSLNI